MSLLHHLQLQPIDLPADDTSNGYSSQDNIDLDEQLDDDNLTSFWSEVVNDLHEDPDWVTFTD